MVQDNEKPLISVITVVFNGENSIENTILSVINQTFNNYEYIIIDGKSTDLSVEIIKKYEDKITFWESEADQGIYDAMNKGIRKAKGKWLYFLNSNDNFFNNTVLEDISSVLLASKFSLVVGKVKVSDGANIVNEYPKPYKDTKIHGRRLFQSHFCHQAIFQKKESCLLHNLFNLQYKIFADFEMIGKVALSEGGFTKIPNYVSFFDINGYSSNWQNAISIFKEQEAVLESLGFPLSKLAFRFMYIKAALYSYRKRFISAYSISWKS